MTESHRKIQKVSKSPSISSINININMNVQPQNNSHRNLKSNQMMNGKKIGQINDIQLMSMNKDHIFSMRPNISTQSLARNKKLFMQNLSVNFNQKQSNKKPYINIDYNDQYLETFNHQDEVQFQLYNNNNNSLKCSKNKQQFQKIQKTQKQKDDKSKSYLNFTKKQNTNKDLLTYSNSHSHTLKKQTNNANINITEFDNKNIKTKRKSSHSKSKSKSKSKQFSRSKSKEFSRSKSISPSKSLKSNKQKSIQLILNKSKQKKGKGKDPQKSISISRELQRQKKVNASQKISNKKISWKSRQKNIQKRVSKSGQKSKSKGKSKSKQKIKSKSKQKYSIGFFVKPKTSPSKLLKENQQNNKMNKTQKINHKNSKILATKTTSTNFYRPQKQGNNRISQKKNKNSLTNNQATIKKKQEKKIDTRLKSINKFNSKKYLAQYKEPQFIQKVIFIQKMWKGYWIRKVFEQQLKQINKRVKKVQTSISKKSAKYWNSNKSSINSVQNIEQFQIDKNQVLAQRQKDIQRMLCFRKPHKLLQKLNTKNINLSDSSFASQKNISESVDRSDFEIQKLREKVLEESLKNQKLLEQNQKLKQHILSVSAKSKSQKSSSYANSPPQSDNNSIHNKQEQKHANKQFFIRPQAQSEQQYSFEKQLKRQQKMVLLPIIKIQKQQIYQIDGKRFSFKNDTFFEKLQLASQKNQQKQLLKQKNKDIQHELQQKKVQKVFNIIDMSPVIKTQQHQIENMNQIILKQQKKLKNIFIDINKVEIEEQNNSLFQNSLKKKFQFYQCSPRSNSNINVSSILQTGEYQKKVIQCKILQEQFQRKIRLLNQIKRDNLISPKSFDIKIFNLSKQYQKNKMIIDQEIINSSRSNKSASSSKIVSEIQSQRMFLKTVQKRLPEQKQNISSEYKKNSISKYLNFQNQQSQKVLINNESSFEVHENQNKFRLSSEEDQTNSQRNQVNNEEEESFSKFFQRLQKQQDKKGENIIEQIKECDLLRKQGEKRIMQIMNLQSQSQSQQSQSENIPNQMVSPSNQSVVRSQRKIGFATHLLYVKNMIFQFFDFIRKSPQFQRQIFQNLLTCPFSLQDFLKTYRTRFNQISDVYQDKQEGEFYIYSYFRYLIDMKPIISPQIFECFEDLRLPFQIPGQMDGSMSGSQNMMAGQNEQMDIEILKRIFNMFLFDVLNQAFQEERVDLQICKGLSVSKPQLVNYPPIVKSLQIFDKLQMMGYNLDQINMPEQGYDQNQNYSLQKGIQQEIQIKKLLKEKGSFLDIVICNIVKKILQNWGRCLCGIIIQEGQEQRMKMTLDSLNLKRQERMSILLEKYLFDNESNLECMLKQNQISVKIALQDMIFKDLVRQFTQELAFLQQKSQSQRQRQNQRY